MPPTNPLELKDLRACLIDCFTRAFQQTRSLMIGWAAWRKRTLIWASSRVWFSGYVHLLWDQTLVPKIENVTNKKKPSECKTFRARRLYAGEVQACSIIDGKGTPVGEWSLQVEGDGPFPA